MGSAPRGGTPRGARGAGGAPAPLSGAAAAAQSEKEQRAVYWGQRKALDTRMRTLVGRMEERLLGFGAALLIAEPSCERTRRALALLAATLVAHVERLKWRAEGGGVAGRALLIAIAEATPWLSDAQLHDALGAYLTSAARKPLPSSLLNGAVSLLRSKWTTLAAELPKLESIRRAPLLLLLDEALAALPWESIPSLRGQPVSRLPCAGFLGRCTAAAATAGDGQAAAAGSVGSSVEAGVASSDAYFVLNPGGDLERTQATFERRFAQPPWEGVVGEAPREGALCAALGAKQLFIYCGHGDGSRYVGADELQRLPRCAVSLLMGCSSGALTRHGGLAPSGIALSYLHARCPALIGNLWDVTDGEIDRLCDALLSECIKGGCLLAAVARAREACRLPYLTGAAAVCYGVPLRILPRGSTTA